MKTKLTKIISKFDLSVEFKKIMKNSGWLFLEKISRLFLSFFVTVWIARYLGPDNYGLLNYCIAFVAIFSVLATVGLSDGLIVKNLVETRDRNDEITGSALILRLSASAVACIIAVVVSMIIRPNQPLIQFGVGVIAFGMGFQSFDIIDYWFQSHVQSKYVVWVRFSSLVVVSALRIIAILNHLSVRYFILLFALEFILVALGLVIAFGKVNKKSFFNYVKISIHRMSVLFKESWPLFLSGIGYVVYIKIDQIMLGEMLGERSVGLYVAASKITETLNFVPLVIISSVFPNLIKTRKAQYDLFTKRFQSLIDGLTWLGIVFSLIISLSSPWIINLLYDDAYQTSSIILSIHIWSTILIFSRLALGRWLVVEGLLKFSLLSQGIGALFNVLANWIMIPRFGGSGAAIATLCAYFGSGYIACLMYKRTWPAAKILFKGLIVPVRSITNRKLI